MDVKGSCLCSNIEFLVRDIGKKMYQCHCSLCRKQGGSASNSGTVVPMDKLQWIKGEKFIKTWRKSTGFTTSFCSNCGSLVPNPLRKFDYYWVPVGTLDDADFKIVMSIYAGSKASWSVLAPGVEQHETMPDFEEFIAILRQGHNN